ncbi:MAG TPA: S-adenosylmethionine:tRNA ribosyltransferase-isomerase [Flavitalea sp.]|nr:S-adenosylmethionine:tRNA ribosyltransferase-isomerase [Flavitalea sp.]
MNPRHISIAEYDYPLPDSRIASFPLEQRDNSKLLIWQNEKISEDVFKNIHHHLPSHSLLILNDTKVVQARIIFQKPTGARIEIFALEPAEQYADTATAFSQRCSVNWKCMVGRASSWMHQSTLEKKLNDHCNLYAKIISKESDHFIIQLSWTPEELSFAEILLLAGATPLPPYIKRKPEASDTERYQTVYAHHSGSVAAPTAGLHFTPEVLNNIDAASIDADFVTLHVSAGTFKPVKAEYMAAHEMHSEFIQVKRSLIEKLISGRKTPVIAVGTTSLRTLETLYWIGEKIFRNKNISSDDLHIQQWDPYDHPGDVSAGESLRSLLSWMDVHQMNSLITRTSLLIAPPYKFRLVDILITNFHQPRSTLLLLVAAFIGKKWKSVYAYALENNFRFLSYGDSCLLFRQ